MHLTTPRRSACPQHPWVWPERITTDRQVEEVFQSTWCHTYALTDPQEIAEHWKHLAELYDLTLHTLPREARPDLEDRLKVLCKRAKYLGEEASALPATTPDLLDATRRGSRRFALGRRRLFQECRKWFGRRPD
jgi:hypothetical protein